MIYLVSKQSKLFDSKYYELLSPEDAIEMLSKESILGADTETQGLDCHSKKILTIQLGTEDFQIVWDCTTYSIQLLKPILENPNVKTIWWNAKFDLQFLYKVGIIPENIYDGILAEKLLWLGYPSGMHSMSLAAAGQQYCGVELDKSVRGEIITRGLTEAVVRYAGYDVKYEIPIYKAQLKELEKKDLLEAIKFENEFVKVLAYIEFCGVKLDVNKWKAKMEKDSEAYNKAKESLDKWVVEHAEEYDLVEYTKVDLQGNLFTGFDTDPKCKLNWSSSKQLIPFFQKLGFNLETFDKQTKKTKLSVESKIIESQSYICDIAPLYVTYKKYEKVVTTYGQNFLDAINKTTGRIHPTFSQLMDTSRLSCGGNDCKINL